MNRNNNSNNLRVDMKNFPVRPKSLTPSVLGMATSHGVKLSVNMTSEDKEKLMSKLEEWRKARKDKLAARILTKQKQFEKTKQPVSASVLPSKSRPSAVQHDGASKFHDRQSVFERLYNNGKMKKLDISSSSNKPTLIPKPNFSKSSSMPSEKPNEPVQVSHIGADETNLSHTSTESLTSLVGEECQESANDEPVAEHSGENCDAAFIDGGIHTQVTNVHESTNLSKPSSSQTGKAPTVPSFKLIRQTDATETDFQKCGSVLENLATKAAVQSGEVEKKKNPLRRSISMMFRQKCRNEYTIRRSFSAKNLNEFNLSQQKLNRSSVRNAAQLPQPPTDHVGEGKNETTAKYVSFVSPKCNKSLRSSNLRTKLEDWLKKNGHPLEGYRHLRCFGIANTEKSFPSAPALPLDHSFENSYYATAPNTPLNDSDKENLAPPTVAHHLDMNIVENWLKELHRLTVELKYPPERCEEWLTAIRKKCTACTQLPIYWECLAALHELKGDLKSAIEDYERVIIKGGEVDAVGESLAQLFEKMVIEQKQRSKPKLEKGLDPKNIFKSTIIKFALQQKALKKLSSKIDPGVRQQLYVATPVRRSTRIQTPYKSNGEVTSLQTLTPELRKNVIFKPNESLLRGD